MKDVTICPVCGAKSSVYGHGERRKLGVQVRYRGCDCGYRWSTCELPIEEYEELLAEVEVKETKTELLKKLTKISNKLDDLYRETAGAMILKYNLYDKLSHMEKLIIDMEDEI